MLGKDYRVLEPIGIGGMAVVYLVEHQTLLKQFAAKVLSQALASSLEARARFTQEAHSASQLDHDNIVSITDFGVTVDHRPFFVMELLRGQTLDQRLTESRMTIEEVVAVGVPVARALAHAHAEGIVHLDVKPENIFLVQRRQGRWRVKVVDFGIAKTPLSPGPAKAGETSGSPQFMAPEMCRGDEDIDQRADIYSFGILLYLMMCGRLPFVDDSVDRVLEMQLVQLPPPPREVNAALTPELAAIIERALAKRPEDRYPSMDALMRDLEAALPPGSDRMLIEAASGATMGDTPFAGALSGMDSLRMARQSQPLPIAPARRFPFVALAALAATLIGALLWHQLGKPAAPSPARVAQARAITPPPPPRPELAPPRVEPAEVPAPAAAPPNAPPSDSSDSSDAARPDPAPAPVQVATGRPVDPRYAAVRPRPGPAPIGPDHRTRQANPPPHPAIPPAPIAGTPAAAPVPPPAPEPTALETTPVVAPAPPPVEPAREPPSLLPPPAPPVELRAPPPPRGSLDATPAVLSLDVKGSLSPSIVRRSVERTLASLRACYRAAARAGGATPALELRLAFEIDENSLATHVAISGASFGSLASCAAGVAAQIRTQEAPDVGTAQVSVVIGFRPS
jgi:eukaryotic-like serine/threonine-protein kinase